MMREVLLINYPCMRVQSSLCTRTWELAGHLEEIDTVELHENIRNPAGDHRAVHTWRARTNVPPLLAPHLDVDYFAWTASVEWRADSLISHWRIEPHALRDALTCTAQLALTDALGGRGARLILELAIDGLDGRQGIATLAYRLVAANWRKLIQACERQLESQDQRASNLTRL